MPCVRSIGPRVRPALFTAAMLMGCFYAETLLNFVEWQVHTVDAQRGTVREIARLAFFRVKVLHACI